MKKMNRKGFTIVELVIVIAVIAILAAVLIPTFSGVVANANESAALSEARAALTNALTMSESGTLPSGTVFAVKNGNNIYYFTYKANQLTTSSDDEVTALRDATKVSQLIVSNDVTDSAKGKDSLEIFNTTVNPKLDGTKVVGKNDYATQFVTGTDAYTITNWVNGGYVVAGAATDKADKAYTAADGVYFTKDTTKEPAEYTATAVAKDATLDAYYKKDLVTYKAYYTADMLTTTVIFVKAVN